MNNKTKNVLQLPREEQLILQQQLIKFSERAMFSITLNQLINDWRYFVVQVERGYPDNIYEYDNDLAVRDLLQELMDLGLPSFNAQLSTFLATWDHRFCAATDEQSSQATVVPPARWWWHRTPKIAIEE